MAVYALGEVEPSIAPDAYVHPDAVVIGAVTIDSHASVWPGAVLRGDFGTIRVGERTSIQDGTVVHAGADWPTEIGGSCVVGHNAHLEGCVIEDGCLIGSMSTTLPGTVIRAGAVIGAMALVTHGTDVPKGSLVLGVPGRVRPNDGDTSWIEAGVRQYVDNAQRYRRELRRLD